MSTELTKKSLAPTHQTCFSAKPRKGMQYFKASHITLSNVLEALELKSWICWFRMTPNDIMEIYRNPPMPPPININNKVLFPWMHWHWGWLAIWFQASKPWMIQTSAMYGIRVTPSNDKGGTNYENLWNHQLMRTTCKKKMNDTHFWELIEC